MARLGRHYSGMYRDGCPAAHYKRYAFLMRFRGIQGLGGSKERIADGVLLPPDAKKARRSPGQGGRAGGRSMELRCRKPIQLSQKGTGLN